MLLAFSFLCLHLHIRKDLLLLFPKVVVQCVWYLLPSPPHPVPQTRGSITQSSSFCTEVTVAHTHPLASGALAQRLASGQTAAFPFQTTAQTRPNTTGHSPPFGT